MQERGPKAPPCFTSLAVLERDWKLRDSRRGSRWRVVSATRRWVDRLAVEACGRLGKHRVVTTVEDLDGVTVSQRTNLNRGDATGGYVHHVADLLAVECDDELCGSALIGSIAGSRVVKRDGDRCVVTGGGRDGRSRCDHWRYR